MNIVNEELFKPTTGMIVVTTNATVNQDGCLVMGRGAALQARDMIPGIDRQAGALILNSTKTTVTDNGVSFDSFYYGFLQIRPSGNGKAGFGIFQVKYQFAENARLSLIKASCLSLVSWMHKHPDIPVRMNYPGIGAGHLTEKDVSPILRVLDFDNLLTITRK
jgi:hypothetical protein